MFIFVLIHLCLTPGVLIATYSYYFLTQFGSFLFVRMKYYVELSSGRTIFVLLAMSNWKKRRFYAFDPPIKKNGYEFQTFYIRPHSGVDSGQWDWGIKCYDVMTRVHQNAPQIFQGKAIHQARSCYVLLPLASILCTLRKLVSYFGTTTLPSIQIISSWLELVASYFYKRNEK